MKQNLKLLCSILLLCASVRGTFAQSTNVWTYMHGEKTPNPSPVYGPYIPPHPDNTPGSRRGGVTWTDQAGNLWLFGGYGYDVSGNLGYLNDLWKYDIAYNEWIWMKGDNSVNSNGSYGIKGVPAAGNNPPAREGGVSLGVDNDGNFWLFGGALRSGHYTNDLWRYNPVSNSWTWMQGSNTMLTEASTATNPGSRSDCASWFRASDNTLWLFGGSNNWWWDRYSDVWKYSVSTNQWTLAKAGGIDTKGVYGTSGSAHSNNVPGSRGYSGSVVDRFGNFLLFGGLGKDSSAVSSFGVLNDIWKFNPVTAQWTWVDGSPLIVQTGTYGTQGTGSTSNQFGARMNMGVTHRTHSGNDVWIFGGSGLATSSTGGDLNDFWKYNYGSQQQTWVGGTNTVNHAGSYGTVGVPHISNIPKARGRSMYWTDKQGNFWMYGGHAGGTLTNDLWKYNHYTGMWTWMKGASSGSVDGVYGTQAGSSFLASPGGSWGSMACKDQAGNFYLFGGIRDNASDLYNYLWRYYPASNEWIWIGGNSSPNQVGSYGVKGVSASSNMISSRYSGNMWMDITNQLIWVFGGYRSISGGNPIASTNDLWKYDLATGIWTWMSGSNMTNQYGVYGTKGTSSASNVPGARKDAVSWIDNNGNLWLMGGDGCGESTAGLLNDLWKYNIASGQWTWVGGNKNVDIYGSFGTKGVESATNYPGARMEGTAWTDGLYVWLHGGYGKPSDDYSGTGYLNDLWRYNTSNNQWTWISGDANNNNGGTYGTKGIASISNKPGARMSSTSWIDVNGTLWLFGGYGFPSALSTEGYMNDLWKYQAGKWTWVSGGNNRDQFGVYGIRETPDPANIPGSRYDACGWIDNFNNLWLLGGAGYTYNNWGGLNDLWKYKPTGGGAESFAISLNTQDKEPVSRLKEDVLKVYPNPTSHQLFIQSDQVFEYLEIKDVLGRTVLIVDHPSRNAIDVSLLTKGIYHLFASNGEKIYHAGFVKE